MKKYCVVIAKTSKPQLAFLSSSWIWINCRDCSSHFSFSFWMNCFSVSRPSPGFGENPFFGVVGLCLGCPAKERRKDHSGHLVYTYRHDLYVFLWPLRLIPTKEKKKVCSTHTDFSVFQKKKQSEIYFIGAKAQSFWTVISPQALSLKVFYKLRAVLRVYRELRLLEERITSSLLDIYKNKGLHLMLECQWVKWALPGQDSPYLIDDVENRWMTFLLHKWTLCSHDPPVWWLNRGASFPLPWKISFCLYTGQCGAGVVSPWMQMHGLLAIGISLLLFLWNTAVYLALTLTTCLKLQHLVDTYWSATRYHTVQKSYLTGSAWLLSWHHWLHQNHYMVCLQK